MSTGGMILIGESQSTRRKTCWPQISHGLAWDRIQPSAMRTRWLALWTMARLVFIFVTPCFNTVETLPFAPCFHLEKWCCYCFLTWRVLSFSTGELGSSMQIVVLCKDTKICFAELSSISWQNNGFCFYTIDGHIPYKWRCQRQQTSVTHLWNANSTVQVLFPVISSPFQRLNLSHTGRNLAVTKRWCQLPLPA
jgi:hypothetical protein